MVNKSWNYFLNKTIKKNPKISLKKIITKAKKLYLLNKKSKNYTQKAGSKNSFSKKGVIKNYKLEYKI